MYHVHPKRSKGKRWLLRFQRWEVAVSWLRGGRKHRLVRSGVPGCSDCHNEVPEIEHVCLTSLRWRCQQGQSHLKTMRQNLVLLVVYWPSLPFLAWRNFFPMVLSPCSCVSVAEFFLAWGYKISWSRDSPYYSMMHCIYILAIIPFAKGSLLRDRVLDSAYEFGCRVQVNS